MSPCFGNTLIQFKLAVCLFGISILTTACSPVKTPFPTPAGLDSWETYKSDRFGFELRYPSGGRVIEVPEEFDVFDVDLQPEGDTTIKRLAIKSREVRPNKNVFLECQTPEADQYPYWDEWIPGEELVIGGHVSYKQFSPYSNCGEGICSVWTSYSISRPFKSYSKKLTCVSVTIYTIVPHDSTAEYPTRVPTPIMEHSLDDVELIEKIISSLIWND